MAVKQTRLNGFTLVELLIVIVVIAILASITLVAYNGVQARARDSARKSAVAEITKGLELYYIANGHYPPSTGSTAINGGWATTADTSWQTLAGTLKSYMSSLPTDPNPTPGINILNSPSTNAYDFAYFTNGNGVYCGTGPYQMYLLVYRLETDSTTNTLEGSCPVSPVGPYGNGNSNYRVVK